MLLLGSMLGEDQLKVLSHPRPTAPIQMPMQSSVFKVKILTDLKKAAMRIKVRGGTAIGGENLCLSCRNATVIKGFGPEQIIHCGDVGETLKFPVSECSVYDNKSSITLSTMRDVAWILVPRKGDGCGFVNPSMFVDMVKDGRLKDVDTRFTKSGGYIDDTEPPSV